MKFVYNSGNLATLFDITRNEYIFRIAEKPYLKP
jgi:hypothetical protein